MNQTHHDNHQRGFFAPANIALIGFLAIAGYFLVTEHRAHLALAIPYLPFLLLLACPLLHVFMHRGHHHHHDHAASDDDQKPTGGTVP